MIRHGRDSRYRPEPSLHGSYIPRQLSCRPLAAREIALSKYPDFEQEVYWCIDLADGEGMTTRTVMEMLEPSGVFTARLRTRTKVALGLLRTNGLIVQDDEKWYTTDS